MFRFILVGFALLLVGCATPGVDRADENQMIQEFYAEVKQVTPVEFSSEVGTGVLVGAGVGVLDNLDGDSEDMFAGALVGALFGGLFTGLAEGSDQAFEYQLYSPERGDVTVIQKEAIGHAVTCVKVRVSSTASVYPAPAERCAS